MRPPMQGLDDETSSCEQDQPATPLPVPENAPGELFVEADGLRLGALSWGPTDGQRVLALHGWLDNAATFTALAPRLPGCHIVALDFPGHGRSTHRGPASSYHFADYVVAAIAAANHLGWDRFALLGHSMGAAVAALVAGTVPERIERAALIEGIGPLTAAPEQTPELLAAAVHRVGSLKDSQPRVYPARAEALTRFQEARRGLSREAAEPVFARAVEAVDGGVRFRHDPALRAPSRLRYTEPQVLAFLRRIGCPVKLISASRGWPYDPVMMEARCAAVARLEHVQLDGHHHLHLDAAEAVAGELASFLAQG